jgi:hypothetical protein
VASVTRANSVRPADIEMIAIFAKQVDPLFRNGFGQAAVSIWRRTHERLEFRMQATNEFCECRVHCWLIRKSCEG